MGGSRLVPVVSVPLEIGRLVKRLSSRFYCHLTMNARGLRHDHSLTVCLPNLVHCSDNDLCRIFLEQNRWKVFKSDLVHQLSSLPTIHRKHHHHQEQGGAGIEGQSADKRGILQLGSNKAKAEQVCMGPPDTRRSK